MHNRSGQNRKKSFIFAGLLILFTFMPMSSIIFAESRYLVQVMQISDNTVEAEKNPQISGNNVVWQGFDGNDFEIYFWNGSTITQISDNSYEDRDPRISGNNVVWESSDGNDWEIFFWNGNTITQVTDNTYDDTDPRISGNNITWQGEEGGTDWEIYFWNGSTITQITDNSYDDKHPQISGNVVWQGFDGNDWEVYLWNVSSIIQISNNSYDDGNPQISGNNVVWSLDDGNDMETFFWDGNKIQITSNDHHDYCPQISGNNVVWHGPAVDNDQIFSWDGTTIRQISYNYSNVEIDIYGIRISGNNIVWQNGKELWEAEIFFSDGSILMQISENTNILDQSPQISGNNVVWYEYDGHDTEIIFCRLIPYIQGTKWHDKNGNSILDPDEKGLTGSLIYADLNENGQFDSNEPNDITDLNGNYELLVLADSPAIVIAEERHSCWEQTYPGGEGIHIIRLEYGKPTGINFGNARLGEVRPAQIVELQKLLASNGASDDNFGQSVSVNHDHAIVGAIYNDDNESDSGSAYIFSLNGIDCNNWYEVAKLTASDATANDGFGSSVSINGGYALVGAVKGDGNSTDTGCAYIFLQNDVDPDKWDQIKTLSASDGAINDKFGISVSIEGDYAIVGADQNDSNGAAYIFYRHQGGTNNWGQQTKLTASDGASNDKFGASVSIDGDYAIVGAYCDNDKGMQSGSVYIFKRYGSSWVLQDKLTASDGDVEDHFGYAVSISGDYALIGALDDEENGPYSGSAYIFQRNVTGWSQQAKLLASDGESSDYFGNAVSISGDYATIGAFGNDSGRGSVYVFTRSGKSWIQEKQLIPSDGGAQGDNFGHSVATDGFNILVGATGDDDKGDGAGSAYMFNKVPCSNADLTNDCKVNFEDLAVTASQWLQGCE